MNENELFAAIEKLFWDAHKEVTKTADTMTKADALELANDKLEIAMNNFRVACYAKAEGKCNKTRLNAQFEMTKAEYLKTLIIRDNLMKK